MTGHIRKAICLFSIPIVFILANFSPLSGGCFTQSGLIDIPTAYVLPHQVPEVSLSGLLYTDQRGKDHMKGGQMLNLGLFDWVQVGLTNESENNFAGSIRVKLLHDERYLPALAIGVQNITDNEDISEYGQDFTYDRKQNYSAYFALSKKLPIFPALGLTFHGGIGSGRFQAAEGRRAEKLHGIFLGMEMSPVRQLTFIFEEDGLDINMGIVFTPVEGLGIKAAITEIEQNFGLESDTSSRDPKTVTKLALGLSYRFDFFRRSVSRKERLLEVLREQEEENEALQRELEDIRMRRMKAEDEIEQLRQKLEGDIPEETTEKKTLDDLTEEIDISLAEAAPIETPPIETQPVIFEEKVPIVLDGVTFETGSTELTGDARNTLARVLATLESYPEIALEIRGHTDSTGPAELNTRLSRERAQAVMQFLVDRGAGSDRLSAMGAGPDQPVADNGTAEGRAKNRRIEFIRVN